MHWLLVVVFLCALSFTAGASPVAPERPEGFERRMDELVRWIAANSDYRASVGNLPVIVFLPPEQIRHAFSGSGMGYRSETSSVRAALTNGTIYLPDTFTLGRDDYILVHELVHHFQEESGKRFACLAEREREAYLLQTKFVHEHGTGEVPNDMYMLLLRCDIR